MKRSRTVAALLLGGVSPLLVSCGDDPPEEAKVYPSVEVCTQELPAEDCAQAFAAATAEHRQDAPRFDTLEACETEVGDDACQRQADGRSPFGEVFVPAMVGFMVGRSLSGNFAQPVYFDRQGFARSGMDRIGQLPPRREDDRPGGGSAGGSAGGTSAAYYRGWTNSGRPTTITTAGSTAGRSAGFGSTGSARGFSGS